MQYNETQLSKLISEVEKEFAGFLAKAEAEETTLAKSEDKKPEEKPEHKHEEKPQQEAKPEGEQKPEGKPEMQQKPEAQAEAKPEGQMPPQEGQPQQGQPPMQQQAGHDYDEEDMQHMKSMYMSMSEPELKAHHDCIAQLMKCGGAPMGMGKSEVSDENPELNSKPTDKGSELINQKRADGGEIEAAPPGKIPGAKSEASKTHGEEMNKSENVQVELLKSELTANNAKYEDLKKNFDAVAAILTKLVDKKAAPAGKAITSLEVIEKSEGTEEKTLTKSEIHSKLVKKSSEPTLAKSDRDAINNYYGSGQVDIKGISHLLN